jgi:hypothetical protein
MYRFVAAQHLQCGFRSPNGLERLWTGKISEASNLEWSIETVVVHNLLQRQRVAPVQAEYEMKPSSPYYSSLGASSQRYPWPRPRRSAKFVVIWISIFVGVLLVIFYLQSRKRGLELQTKSGGAAKGMREE